MGLKRDQPRRDYCQIWKVYFTCDVCGTFRLNWRLTMKLEEIKKAVEELTDAEKREFFSEIII